LNFFLLNIRQIKIDKNPIIATFSKSHIGTLELLSLTKLLKNAYRFGPGNLPNTLYNNILIELAAPAYFFSTLTKQIPFAEGIIPLPAKKYNQNKGRKT
jgi:hypothetical protein